MLWALAWVAERQAKREDSLFFWGAKVMSVVVPPAMADLVPRYCLISVYTMDGDVPVS